MWGRELCSVPCGDLTGKGIQKRGYIYIYTRLVHVAVQQKLTWRCKATMFPIKNKSNMADAALQGTSPHLKRKMFTRRTR